MFDPKCYEVAEYFLPTGQQLERLRETLAQDIQDFIEDWMRGERERLAAVAIGPTIRN